MASPAGLEPGEKVVNDLARRLAFFDRIYVPKGADHFAEVVTTSAILESTARMNSWSEESLLPTTAGRSAVVNPSARKKNDYLSHPFHKYKAKFFPRLARSLTNITCPAATGVVLDPFCGSGTTGVEASLMGLRSICFDLDPLSVFISETKTRLEDVNVDELDGIEEWLRTAPKAGTVQKSFGDVRFTLPKFLLERNP